MDATPFWQNILVFVVVALAAAYLIRALVRKGKQGCGDDCSCASKIRRDPVIERFLRDRK